MVEQVKKREKTISAGEILNLVAAGDCDKLRKYFDAAFWDNKKPVLSWEHLKTALKKNDRPMMRLLIVWGASPPPDTTGITADQWRLLRLCGLPKNYAPSPFLIPEDHSIEGIFVGQYSPKDRNGNSLGKTFNVFAARWDLPKQMTYDDTVRYIAGLKNFYGFDGTNYANDTEIYAALKNGSYTGGWIIPTRDILIGKDVDGKATTPDSLYKFVVASDLKWAFNTDASSDSSWYYSSSTENNSHLSSVHVVRFSDGCDGFALNIIHRLSCRPVRLVAAV